MADLDIAQGHPGDGHPPRSSIRCLRPGGRWARQIHNGKDFPVGNVPALVSSNNSVEVRLCADALRFVHREERQDHPESHQAGRRGKTGPGRLSGIGRHGRSPGGHRKGRCNCSRWPPWRPFASRRVSSKITVVVGSPSFVNGKRRNSAYAIGPDGSILTRYDQIVVSRPDLFEGGMSTKAMWFQVNGVWSIADHRRRRTVDRDGGVGGPARSAPALPPVSRPEHELRPRPCCTTRSWPTWPASARSRW